MVQLSGFEPPTFGATIRRSNQLSYNCIVAQRLQTSGADFKEMFVARKSPGENPGLCRKLASAERGQTGALKDFSTCALTGAKLSVATFWDSSPISLA